ncbi:Co2+/Mg2+ efflux protein ApaG [Sphingobacterium mizutaii NBRC 14946 = DSM 11724]|uniref:CO2+/MG2+ efflux protein ApaG n=2 Tax=Sphingobacterium mizutaii TaxID=1010 RepID=A0AAJ4XFR2_9SPHI|nr:Co2+/Mg2+ efflux protein ApaG [Sphingobacterium mizutaii]GEM66889.1 Co2+/Mg2+ efflux protein ApaG [Sphingobacterium mizutaii NBRC 14946 = DSM 11724]SDL60704.1 ApaG protein [Sphingobacterium mizutaii]SNV66116.1 CO2+/MG2+ efflux protein ApaG [Sphingobacterium mizutaii]
MTTQTTSGVKISVESTYQSEYSNPENEHFMFAYRITIENLSEYTVQLVRRHWNIYDSIGLNKQVDGDGVVGEQPILEPGQMHQYVSGCNLKSDMGFMEGYYEMIREMDNSIFHVHIPRFNLIANYRLN